MQAREHVGHIGLERFTASITALIVLRSIPVFPCGINHYLITF